MKIVDSCRLPVASKSGDETGNWQLTTNNWCDMSMIHDITGAVPRNKKSQRKGRGESSGRGKTCGRGTKGSKARVGTYIKPGYEGGQTPIFRRFPKRGFSNENFENRFHVVNLSELDRFDNGTTVDGAALIAAGLVADDCLPVKILGDGSISKKLTVQVDWFSKSAFEKIVAAGGAAQNTKGETFQFPKPKKKFVPREAAKKAKKGEEPKAAEGATPDKPAEGAAPAANQ
jgi:large subunit ribosomal protein L15